MATVGAYIRLLCAIKYTCSTATSTLQVTFTLLLLLLVLRGRVSLWQAPTLTRSRHVLPQAKHDHSAYCHHKSIQHKWKQKKTKYQDYKCLLLLLTLWKKAKNSLFIQSPFSLILCVFHVTFCHSSALDLHFLGLPWLHRRSISLSEWLVPFASHSLNFRLTSLFINDPIGLAPLIALELTSLSGNIFGATSSLSHTLTAHSHKKHQAFHPYSPVSHESCQIAQFPGDSWSK